MAKRRKSKRKRREENRFRLGDRVRVKDGVTDFNYADMPMGGWAGQICEVVEGGMYTVRWSPETLEAIHPVFRTRCEKDGLVLEEYALDEEDLEPDPGGPLQIEQPAEIKTEPLDPKDAGDRIRMVFGLTSNDPLPNVDKAALLAYHRRLIENLPLPFNGEYLAKTDPFESRRHVVKVTGLPDPDEYDCNEMYGLMCEVREGRRKWQVPLIDIEVYGGSGVAAMLTDYGYWFYNR